MDAFAPAPSRVTGHLDGLRSGRIEGWAFAGSLPCRIEVKDSTGSVIASETACLERPDLLSLGQNRCDFAFSIALPPGEQAEILHVLADGVEITNSPLVLVTGVFDGAFEIKSGRVEGWVRERRGGATPPMVTIRDQDEHIVFQAQSTYGRGIHGSVGDTARFAGHLAQHCFGAGERCLSAFANGRKFAQSSCSLPLRGNVEEVLPDRCTGWLVSPDSPAWPFEFDVLRDGEVVARAHCNIHRGDVQDLFPGALRAGFSCVLPPVEMKATAFTTISFRFPESRRELFDGPFMVAERAAVIEAARIASRMAVPRADDPVGHAVQAVAQAAVQDFLVKARATERTVFRKCFVYGTASAAKIRISIIIPIFRGVSVTKDCIDSVLRCRSADQDRIILVQDQSPEPDMAAMLHKYLTERNVVLLNNERNLGFVKSVNRGLSFCENEDVLLLNSDTRLFPGAMDLLYNVAHKSSDIGTVTAISNNATIFSYPHFEVRRPELDDIGWEELAEIALRLNGDMSIDVPSGHGFCMLIKRAVLDRLHNLDEAFGRGYGEENDFCVRAADLGFRNVAAGGVFVQHLESTSFREEKLGLISQNIARLQTRYPEYTPTVMEVERRDDLRIARWALDEERLRLASSRGQTFTLVISHALGGGTGKAMADIEAMVGYGNSSKIALTCRSDGYLMLTADEPQLRVIFCYNEVSRLSKLLSAAVVQLVVVHQVLGFPASFLELLRPLLNNTRSIFYAHDYYAFCPRVTMIDATERFCDQTDVEVCDRCLRLSGSHPSSRLVSVGAAEHRRLFSDFLQSFTRIVAPSSSAVQYVRRAYPELVIDVIPHPRRASIKILPARREHGEIVLFGAIGPHKGSRKLLEIARLARLTKPELHFTVIGYTDIDTDLLRLGNVTITGSYSDEELGYIVTNIKGCLALFLSSWPETYSYTLSEAAAMGFFPVVPDIGAPAERVRNSGYGIVFPFPIEAAQVLELLCEVQLDKSGFAYDASSLISPSLPDASVRKTREIFGLTVNN